MKQFLFYNLLILILSSGINASKFENDPPLFLLEKDGKSSLLFGTMHAASLNVIPDSIKNFIKERASILYVEQDGDVIKVLCEKIIKGDLRIRSEEEYWFTNLNPGEQNEINTLMTKLGNKYDIDFSIVDLNSISRGVLTYIEQFSNQENTARSSLEGELRDYLREDNGTFRLEGLENEESRADTALQIINEEAEGSVITSTFTIGDIIEDDLSNYSKGWRTILEGLSIKQKGSKKEDPITLGDNLKWMNRLISAHLEETFPVFAVGAAHLRGKGGLIDLLRQEGFSVKQVQIDKEHKDEFPTANYYSDSSDSY